MSDPAVHRAVLTPYARDGHAMGASGTLDYFGIKLPVEIHRIAGPDGPLFELQVFAPGADPEWPRRPEEAAAA